MQSRWTYIIVDRLSPGKWRLAQNSHSPWFPRTVFCPAVHGHHGARRKRVSVFCEENCLGKKNLPEPQSMRRAVWLCSCSSVCLAGNSEVPEVGFGFRSGVSGVPSPCLFVEAHGVGEFKDAAAEG
ncbi:hypothetical protein B296_00026573 [Ensete ventricosum]|uniref:Uncharacterized protein n=1 Tax=Ensete ventricosum TaxID=4639 RepID=A0A427A8Q3_ENSVE|nr:hypothetical protein B296_00026573 [Ensete ventricosum]